MNTAEYIISSILPPENRKLQSPRTAVSVVILLVAFTVSFLCGYSVIRSIAAGIYGDLCLIVENMEDFELKNGVLSVDGEDTVIQAGNMTLCISGRTNYASAGLALSTPHLIYIGRTETYILLDDVGYTLNYAELEKDWGSLDCSKAMLESYISRENQYIVTNLITTTAITVFCIAAPLTLVGVLFLQLIYALLCRLFKVQLPFRLRFCICCGCAALPTVLAGFALLALGDLGNLLSCWSAAKGFAILLTLVFCIVSAAYCKKAGHPAEESF